MTTFRLPFGKFKGRAIERVPVEYLSWLLAGCDLRPDIRDTIRGELLDRQASELLAGHE